MKRVGLIDNLSDINYYLESKYYKTSAEEVMVATGGNTGNLAFVFGVRKLLNNPITRVGWGWTPAVVKEKFDHLVICCANQLGSHVDLGPWALKLESFGLPVTLIGLGAQSDNYEEFPQVPDGTIRFLEVVNFYRENKDVPNIGVRGAFTKSFLDNLGFDSLAIGCPSLFITSEKDLGQEIYKRQLKNGIKKVAVSAGNPWHSESSFLEYSLTKIVDQYQGAYILQHPVSLIQYGLSERGNVSAGTVARFAEVYSDSDLENLFEWFRRNSAIFVDVPNWLQFLNAYDLAIGPRYHGVALAVQKGLPGCVFSIDSRTRELAEATGVKQIPVEYLKGLNAEDIVNISLWVRSDADGFDVVRKRNAQLINQLVLGNNLSSSDHIIGLI